MLQKSVEETYYSVPPHLWEKIILAATQRICSGSCLWILKLSFPWSFFFLQHLILTDRCGIWSAIRRLSFFRSCEQKDPVGPLPNMGAVGKFCRNGSEINSKYSGLVSVEVNESLAITFFETTDTTSCTSSRLQNLLISLQKRPAQAIITIDCMSTFPLPAVIFSCRTLTGWKIANFCVNHKEALDVFQKAPGAS